MTVRSAALAVPLGIGAVTAVSLGLYGAIHEPTERDFVLVGFDSVAAWKSAVASLTGVLFLVQVTLGLRITGRYGPRRPPPPWMPDLHRLVGTVAFGLSLPVAFHCLWALGFDAGDARVLVHSSLGTVAYGLYAAKVVAVRRGDGPEWILPVTGSLLGATMLGLWWSAALLHYTS